MQRENEECLDNFFFALLAFPLLIIDIANDNGAVSFKSTK
jgi:hypothetical protein